jgi:hypothetical protein
LQAPAVHELRPTQDGVEQLKTLALRGAAPTLPEWARATLSLQRPMLTALPARAATWGMGRTLRWAFRQDAPRT